LQISYDDDDDGNNDIDDDDDDDGNNDIDDDDDNNNDDDNDDDGNDDNNNDYICIPLSLIINATSRIAATPSIASIDKWPAIFSNLTSIFLLV
jgi:hypothetical protein